MIEALEQYRKELEAARQTLADVEQRWGNYDGNNPDKYRSKMSRARRRVQSLEDLVRVLETAVKNATS